MESVVGQANSDFPKEKQKQKKKCLPPQWDVVRATASENWDKEVVE